MIITVKVSFDDDNDKLTIESDFMNKDGFKNPENDTLKLLQMAMEKWIIDKIGLYCPKCEIKIKPEWSYCPNCGWTWRE